MLLNYLNLKCSHTAEAVCGIIFLKLNYDDYDAPACGQTQKHPCLQDSCTNKCHKTMTSYAKQEQQKHI